MKVTQKKDCHDIQNEHSLHKATGPLSKAEPLVHLACCVISQIANPICFLDVRMPETFGERRNIAPKRSMKALSNSEFGGNIIFTDIRNEAGEFAVQQP